MRASKNPVQVSGSAWQFTIRNASEVGYQSHEIYILDLIENKTWKPDDIVKAK
jgi:hypothetical protein